MRKGTEDYLLKVVQVQGQGSVITRNAWKVRKGEGEGGIREKEGRPDEGTEGLAEGQVEGDGRMARN